MLTNYLDVKLIGRNAINRVFTFSFQKVIWHRRLDKNLKSNPPKYLEK